MDLLFWSPTIGGLNITWDQVMELTVYERNVFVERFSELREGETKTLKALVKAGHYRR